MGNNGILILHFKDLGFMVNHVGNIHGSLGRQENKNPDPWSPFGDLSGHGGWSWCHLATVQMVVKNGDLSMVQSVKKFTFPKNPDPSIAWLVFLRKKQLKLRPTKSHIFCHHMSRSGTKPVPSSGRFPNTAPPVHLFH